MESLADIRKRIDQLDEQIQSAISERAALAQQVARAKQAQGETGDFYRPEREAEVLRMVMQRNQGPLPDEQITGLFRQIMSACLALQKPLRVAYLGPSGTFTEAAARKHFGLWVETLPQGLIDNVFREVESGTAQYGVVPIENSTEGVVHHTLDMFLHSPLRICGEVSLRIHHHLLSREKDLSVLRKVYSHQQSLGQCRQWLETHLSGVETVGVSSNAEAAMLAAGEAGSAAVAGEMAARTYALPILASNIEDEPDNTTRFLIIGNRSVPATGSDKTSLLISTHNKPGALVDLLEPLARHRISMSRIESRPSRRGNWDYVFFVDLEGHGEDAPVAQALQEVEAAAALLKNLGSYPKAVI